MARTGVFQLVINKNTRSVTALDLLRIFQSYGWDINDHGMMAYLPLGDENFDWAFLPLERREEVYFILSEKIKRRELVGISLINEVNDVGLNALFYPSLEKISLSAEINRMTIRGSDVTDFTWYLEKIVPILFEAGLSIETIECIDG